MNKQRLTGLMVDNERKSATILYPDVAVGSFAYQPQLAELGFTCLCLAKAAPSVCPPHLRHPLIDGVGNGDDDIWRCLDFVLDGWAAGQKLAVLCRTGANRAPAILAAALYVAGRASSIYGAIEWMRAHRYEVGHYGRTTSEVEFAVQRRTRVIRLPAPGAPPRTRT